MLPYYNPYHNLVSMQATISQFGLELAILKSRLETQELETQKANSKFEFIVSENEKLKKNFESEKKVWDDEKASLVTRAETTEASLAEATTELSTFIAADKHKRVLNSQGACDDSVLRPRIPFSFVTGPRGGLATCLCRSTFPI